MSLYFFEQLCKFYHDPAGQKWTKDYPKSIPQI
jgi:hypothetical protein